MAVYVPQLTMPKKGNSFYDSDKNVFTASGYPRPNCTTQVEGEWMERYGVPTGCLSNAGGWIRDVKKYKLKWRVSKTPTLGAIAVWKIQGTAENGHVATVEQILENGDIVTSNSGWKSTMWWLETYQAAKGYNYTSKKTGKYYELQGFILPPVTWREQERDFQVVGIPILRLGAGKKHKGIVGMKAGWMFHYTGQYQVVENDKWLYGFYECKNINGQPIRFGGWTEAKNLR